MRARLEDDAANAREVIDRQAALIDELRRGLPGRDAAPGDDPWFRGQAPAGARPGGQAQPAIRAPWRMIETFELDGAPQFSATHSPGGPELVADAVAKPVSSWLPAGAHAEAVVLAGVDASAGVSSQGDPRPVLLRITGPAWTAAEDGTALAVDVDGCTVTGAAHGDLSSEKVYPGFLILGRISGFGAVCGWILAGWRFWGEFVRPPFGGLVCSALFPCCCGEV